MKWKFYVYLSTWWAILLHLKELIKLTSFSCKRHNMFSFLILKLYFPFFLLLPHIKLASYEIYFKLWFRENWPDFVPHKARKGIFSRCSTWCFWVINFFTYISLLYPSFFCLKKLSRFIWKISHEKMRQWHILLICTLNKCRENKILCRPDVMNSQQLACVWMTYFQILLFACYWLISPLTHSLTLLSFVCSKWWQERKKK